MAPGDLDPNGYIPAWRLLLGRAWLSSAAPQRRDAATPAAAPAATKTDPRCCPEHCCA